MAGFSSMARARFHRLDGTCARQLRLRATNYQLRNAVKKPHRKHPEINPTYAEVGQHYGVAIVPARPKKPRDKAKVEVSVQIAQRWIAHAVVREALLIQRGTGHLLPLIGDACAAQPPHAVSVSTTVDDFPREPS